jgi:hypothetical protein
MRLAEKLTAKWLKARQWVSLDATAASLKSKSRCIAMKSAFRFKSQKQELLPQIYADER